MDSMQDLANTVGVAWFVSCILAVAAVIDGWKLKVPNWLTFPFVISGWAYHLATGGFSGFQSSLVGAALGLGLLLIPYAIGGMGAGDVKLFAGVGAWTGPLFTWGAFCVSVVVGGGLALMLVGFHSARSRDWGVAWQSWSRFQTVATEIMTIRSPNQLGELAAARKPTAMLLPYAIPLAFGTIGYFFWLGLL
jgi:prepilin peptidase CpaA